MKFICLLLSFTWIVCEVQKVDELLLTKMGTDIQKIIKWDETTILAVATEKLYWIEIESKKVVRVQENSFHGELIVGSKYVVDAITTDDARLQFDIYHRDFTYFNRIRTYLHSGSYNQILVAEKHLYFLEKSDSDSFLYAVNLVYGNTIPLYSTLRFGDAEIKLTTGKVNGESTIGAIDPAKDIAFFIQDSNLSFHEIKVFRPSDIQFYQGNFYISLDIATATSVLMTNGTLVGGVNYIAIPGKTRGFTIDNDKITTVCSINANEKQKLFVTDLKTNEQLMINQDVYFAEANIHKTKNLIIGFSFWGIDILNYKTNQVYNLKFQYSDPLKVKDMVVFLDTKEKMIVFIEVLD